MIHAQVDDPNVGNIIGFECGNRKAFDAKYADDPYWFFIDTPTILGRIETNGFFLDPRQYFIDNKGIVQKRVGAIPTFVLTVLMKDADGVPLVDSDGVFLTEPM